MITQTAGLLSWWKMAVAGNVNVVAVVGDDAELVAPPGGAFAAMALLADDPVACLAAAPALFATVAALAPFPALAPLVALDPSVAAAAMPAETGSRVASPVMPRRTASREPVSCNFTRKVRL